MSWKKYFKSAPNVTGNLSPISGKKKGDLSKPPMLSSNWESQLPEVYIGHPNRIERYNQYSAMDNDPEVNAALDIIAEFCTQPNKENGTAFDIHFYDRPTDNEVHIIKEQLQQWCKLNELNKRIFRIFRSVLKYGDQVFIRDPETFKLFWTEMEKVTKVIVDESAGKEPEQYFIKDITVNLQTLSTQPIAATDTFTSAPSAGGASSYAPPPGGLTGGSRFTHQQNEIAIDASHIMHITLNEGLDSNWPFGNSVLESVYKVYKQKELLEDSIIIYRVQRAPERRVFKIDVGNMPTHMAMAFVERVKNEINQRRLPTRTGGGASIMDATYSPLSQMEDYFFPQNAEGKGSSVDVLQGGSNVGEITDLRYFTNKLFRALRIPSSYLPTTTDESDRTFNDGKVGTALIQEWRFNQYCVRLQNIIVEALDKEFKMFMRWRGINIDNSLFDLRFNEPQNFAKYRQAELDASSISSFTQLEQIPYLSKRFMLQRFLGLTEEEMQQNEELWNEEHAEKEDMGQPGEGEGGAADLRSVGVTPGALGGDMESVESAEGADADLADLEGGGMPGAAPGGAGGAPAAPEAGAGAPLA